MGLKEIYHAVEDHYYRVLDFIDQHGIPVYRVVDAIEAQNIPSLPIALFALLIVVGGLVVVLGGSGGTALTVLVTNDTQDPIAGVTVRLEGSDLPGDALGGKITNANGEAVFSNLPAGISIRVSGVSDEYSISDK
ncbi:MAG: carboxypeptidase-like regulatory domain-containing protein, partial [archaeon]